MAEDKNTEFDLLIQDLEQITINHPLLHYEASSKWRKGKYGESIAISSINRFLLSTWNPNYDIIERLPKHIQHGLDYRIEYNGHPMFIEMKNWQRYDNGVSWIAFNDEIKDRFKHCNVPNPIKVVVMNKYNITKDFRRWCSWDNIEIIPVSGFVEWYNIYDYNLIETIVDEISNGIKSIYEKHGVKMNNHLPLYESMMDLGRKDCAILMKDMKIDYQIIQKVTGYSMSLIYKL